MLNNTKLNGNKICPNLTFVKTASSRNNPADFTDISPDISTYEGLNDIPTKIDWFLVDLIFELKFKSWSDGFVDIFQNDQQYVERDTAAGRKTRGQLYAYGALQMSSQHRLFVFAIGIYGKFARVYRMDRSSIITSTLVDYIENPEILVELLWRYGQLTRIQRGYDPTVAPATKVEETLYLSQVRGYLERVRKDKNLREHEAAQKTLDSKLPIFKVQVHNTKDATTHFYLVREPAARIPVMSPCSRATIGYIAVRVPPDGQSLTDEEDGRLAWLKDFWRTNDFEAESEILEELKEKGVRHIPIVHCAGDVVFNGVAQVTVNDTWRTKDEAKIWRRPLGGNIRSLTHHRVVEELLHPLSSVTHARELVRAGRDVTEGNIHLYLGYPPILTYF